MAYGDAKHAAVLEAAKEGRLDRLSDALGQLPPETAIASVCDSRGRTALHMAAQHNHAPLCEHLVDKLGCDVNSQDKEGGCARHRVCSGGLLPGFGSLGCGRFARPPPRLPRAVPVKAQRCCNCFCAAVLHMNMASPI